MDSLSFGYLRCGFEAPHWSTSLQVKVNFSNRKLPSSVCSDTCSFAVTALFPLKSSASELLAICSFCFICGLLRSVSIKIASSSDSITRFATFNFRLRVVKVWVRLFETLACHHYFTTVYTPVSVIAYLNLKAFLSTHAFNCYITWQEWAGLQLPA